MDCKYAEKLMMKYMDSEITEKEASALNEHIAGCEKCRQAFYVYDAMLRESEIIAAEEITAPDGFEQAVMAKIKAEKKPVYGYSTSDRIREVCLCVFIALFVSSGVISRNAEAIMAKLYQYPVFRGYIDKVIAFSAKSNIYIQQAADIINGAVISADRILSSMALLIGVCLLAVCLLQAVVYARKNWRR